MRIPLLQIIALSALAAGLSGLAGAEDFELGDQAHLFRMADSHWAFQAVEKPATPKTGSAWPRNGIDHFILEQLNAAGIPHAKEATPPVLIRRLFFGLTGLPPTADAVENWSHDWSNAKYRQLVDHLLASPHYGERWGRYWLDVARYADTKGYLTAGKERRYPFAYTFRDWVVNSLNEDMPYDEFCRLQIAADRFVENKSAEKEDLAALGFLTVGARFINNSHLIIDDRIDVVTRGMQGLTVTCARCHDHMFDPIPTADYYSLYGVFASTEEPAELPAIVAPGDMTDEQRESEKKLADLKANEETFVKDHHAALRDAERIAKYLRFTHTKKGLSRAKTLSASAKAGVLLKIGDRWERYLAQMEKTGDARWKVWHAMLPHLENGDAKAAWSEFEKIEASNPPANPLVLDMMHCAKPQTVDELCEAYAAVLAEADDGTQHAEEHLEKLRLVLRGSGGPVGFEWSSMTGFLDRKANAAFTKIKAARQKAMVETRGVAPRAMIVQNRATPSTPVIFNRGDPRNRGEQVPRQFLSVLEGGNPTPFTKGSGREELAGRITDPANPLTARVMVNRVWMHHFGKPLVDSPSDFGLQTAEPAHRELLDWLAAEFVEGGWSLKNLHRLMLQSSTYRQSSTGAAGWEKDVENRYWGRMERRRLGYEATRDALLSVTGELDRSIGGRPEPLEGENATLRRALYGHIDRSAVPSVMRTFDFADPNLHAPKREETTVPQQALFFMNSPFVQARVVTLNELTQADDPKKRLANIYRRVFARSPVKNEIDAALAFIGNVEEKWEDLIQALIASNAFAFID